MSWVHCTNKDSFNAIIREGFKMPSEVGRFGIGVYFANTSDFGCFGDYKIEVEVSDKVLELTHKEICNSIYPEYNLQEDEEGIPILKDYVIDKGYKAVSIEYSDGDKELVVYDLSIISINNKINKMNLLKDKLIQYQGTGFNFPEHEDVLDDLLEYGEFWDKQNTHMTLNLMENNECHSNSAKYWMNNVYSQISKEELENEEFSIDDYLENYYKENDIYIATGYALSGDSNKWCQHSFLIDKTNLKKQVLIETTPVNWVAYYGIVLNSLDCLDFYDENC